MIVSPAPAGPRSSVYTNLKGSDPSASTYYSVIRSGDGRLERGGNDNRPIDRGIVLAACSDCWPAHGKIAACIGPLVKDFFFFDKRPLVKDWDATGRLHVCIAFACMHARCVA